MAAQSGRTHPIRLTDAVLSTRRVVGRDVPVVRGMLAAHWLHALQRPRYQREELTTEKSQELYDALAPDGFGMPDALLLSAREHEVRHVGAGEMVLTVPVLYIVDGLQRVGAGKRRVADHLQTIDLPVDVLLGLTEPDEIKLFWQINRDQTRVRTDVLLRTVDDVAACVELRRMAANTIGFPEVLWTHQGWSTDKLTGHQLYELAIILHGYAQGRTIEGILDALDELTETIGTAKLVQNVRLFIQLVDELYADTRIREFTRRVGFLRGLAIFLYSYAEFWSKEETLLVRATERSRLKTIRYLDVAGNLTRNNAGTAVQQGIRDHFGKYRKGARALTPRV